MLNSSLNFFNILPYFYDLNLINFLPTLVDDKIFLKTIAMTIFQLFIFKFYINSLLHSKRLWIMIVFSLFITIVLLSWSFKFSPLYLFDKNGDQMYHFEQQFLNRSSKIIFGISFILYFLFQIIFRYIFTITMNFKSNFGSNQDYYAPQNNMGYSNVSRNYNRGISPRNGIEEHGGGLGEVEFMLQNERKKFREAKDRFEMDLDNERKKRIQFQNKLIRLKDEYSRKEVLLSEGQFKINNLLHQNQDLAMENDRLKNQLARLEQIYGGRIQQLEAQLNMQTKNFEDTTLQYNQEFDKFKKEGQDYVEQLTFEMERKIKGLEQRLKGAQMLKRDLAAENKKLNDLLISNRLQFEEQLRDIKNKARDEEIKKAQYLTKSYEQKLKVIEDSKEGLNRKIQQLMRIVQDKDSKILQLEGGYEDHINKLTQDRADLEEKVNQLSYLLSKLKAEIAEKDNMIGRSVNDNDGEVRLLKQQLEGKKQEINQLQSTVRELRMAIKELEGQSERKRRELAERCYSLETEARRYKQEYTRLADILKTKINSTIDNVSYTKKEK